MTNERRLLDASGNTLRLINQVAPLLSADSEASLRSAHDENVRRLYRLGREQYRFARRLSAASWRQAVSRLYYGGYNAVRAVRLAVDGSYSQDASDHRKVGELPDDFPDRVRYGNRLRALRSDRNLCDYDHLAVVADLVELPDGWAALVRELLDAARDYLGDRGIVV